MPIALPDAFGDLLANCQWTRKVAGESGGAVFRLDRDDDEPLYLKYGANRIARDIFDEAARLSWLSGQLPVPRIVQFVATPDAAWLLTTAVQGYTGDALLENDPANLTAIIEGAAAFLKRIHALPVAQCPFEAGREHRLAAARANIDAGRVDIDDFDDDHSGWSAEDVWTELETLRSFEAERVVTHGDYSLGNLLFADDAVTGCIDVGRVGIADPYQDIAILWQNLSDFGPEAQALFVEAMGIDIDTHRLQFHRCLDELF